MELMDRYRGCLLGGAAGDALGYQVEFDSLERIRQMHGERGVRRMGPMISDDTQMTLFTAEGMLAGLRHGMPMPACVYQSYLDWLRTQDGRSKGGVFRKESRLLQQEALMHPRAPGMTCLGALRSGAMGTMDEPVNNSKGCGGVMRTAPCGLLRIMDVPDPEDAYALQGAMAAAITHSHRMGYIPAAMLADVVHQIMLEDGRPLEMIIRDSLNRMMRLFGPEIRDAAGCEGGSGRSDGAFAQLLAFRELMMRAVKLAQTDAVPVEAIGQLGEGWVGDEALAIAVYCVLKFPDDMEECLSAAVSHGGDSDSTGAIAGNIAGAWLGVQGIPEAWLAELELRDVIDETACLLFAAQKK